MQRSAVRWMISVALVIGACVPGGLSSDDEASTATDAGGPNGDGAASDVTSTSDGNVAAGDAAIGDGGAIKDVIDPLDAPDGWEASGPPPPPTCTDAGFRCASKAPAGWTGPFGLYEGNVQNAPSCGSVTQILAAHDSLSQPVPAAQCAACECNPATGTSCGSVRYYGSRGNCTGKVGSSANVLALNACTALTYGTLIDPDGFAANGITFDPSAVVGGSCSPKVAKPTPNLPAYGWDVAVVGCTTQVPTTPGCTGTQVCSAIPDSPFDTRLCIAKDGNIAACPGAPYSRRTLYYKGATDGRDCNGCSCGPVPAANCNATATTSSQFDCSNPENTGAAPGCLAREPGYYYTKVTASPPALNCTPSGGGATGTVTPASPVTVCCEP